MISNSRLQITLLSFLFKKFNTIKKGINIKDTLKFNAPINVNPEGGGGSGKGWGFDQSGGPMGRDLD